MNFLFVCTGNTCRSAMAEALAKKLLSDAGIRDITVSSCGTAVAPTYMVPPIVVALMKAEGIDITQHRPEQLTLKLIQNADIILGMDDYHKQYISSLAPGEKSKVFLLKEYIGETSNLNILDPMGHTDEFYSKTKDELKYYIVKLIERFKNQQKT